MGVGLPDKGRCRLAVRNGVVELYPRPPTSGQGCATVFLQMLAEATGLPLKSLRNMGANPGRWPPTQAPPPVPARP